MNILYVNNSNERVMFRGMGVAPYSFLAFDGRWTPPYQVRALLKQQGVDIDSYAFELDSYDDIIRYMLGGGS